MFHAKKLFEAKNPNFFSLFENIEEPWLLLSKLDSFFKDITFGIHSSLEVGVHLKNESAIFIGKDCVIESGVYIEGPAFIDDESEIRHGAYIRRGSVIGKRCVVGHATEINRSVLLDDSKLPHFNYVGDSVIGERVNMGAGSKCANTRLDKKEISIFYQEKKYQTHRVKLGALIGHDVSIGCNAVINPGTIIYPNAKIAPLSLVKGVIF
jgi:NDP-sugar pyrophosphorylase family protein